ncbi:hypothetical protein [Sharpea azabuensis]|uniref:hypothetical protein n=1 Tax=Sharpea azabuensis TaxID=322505 RepID=UPI003CFFDACC
MKEKQIILKVPAIDREYEVFIPVGITVSGLRQLLVDSVEEITNGQYIASGTEVLCLKEQNIQLLDEKEVSVYGIKNGDTLFLI